MIDDTDAPGGTLTDLFDAVADTIQPRPDVDAVLAGLPRFADVGADRARRAARARKLAGVAAAVVVLTGGGVAALRGSGDDGELATSGTVTQPPTTVAGDPSASAVPATTAADDAARRGPAAVGATTAPIERTAQMGGVALRGDDLVLKVVGTAPVGERVTITTPFGSAEIESRGEWYALVTLVAALPGDAEARVTFAGDGTELPLTFNVPTTPITMPPVAPGATEAPQPSDAATTTVAKDTPPAVVEFTATLGWVDGDGTPLLAGLWGKAAPGSTVSATSASGSGTALVDVDGDWEMVVQMGEVAPGAKVGLRVTNNASVKVFEFTAKAPGGSTPDTKPFTAELGAADLAAEPMKQVIVGTGAPGSTVRVETPYGVAEAVVGSGGGYEARLKLAGVPAGTTVHIRVTNSASTVVREFDVVRLTPPASGFTANAAFTECDSTPPFNEYSGTAPAGSTVTISSDFGGTQVTARTDGTWSARVEFPDAPVGETFLVIVSNTSGSSYTFPLTRTAPR